MLAVVIGKGPRISVGAGQQGRSMLLRCALARPLGCVGPMCSWFSRLRRVVWVSRVTRCRFVGAAFVRSAAYATIVERFVVLEIPVEPP